MNPRWFMRMAKWARHPPSAKRVKLVFAVVAICAALVIYEMLFGTPDWMQMEPLRLRP
ncbi:hypothetical protein GCM10016455_15150 [Aliiroseovarius zhejiangensis]|uniref:Uncharacterized protein n=1 Tax=Aliiroseovarius zhejiangensis TaxID=1632025 RepID=A0ABQ3IWV9_9RHOB|nr:hypothetical protein [Aliiroseovarius zhejiangensis]GHE95433.1 hypothetical protein GCM10016455_15150 [Aliiroseovarius zhejiangensis]